MTLKVALCMRGGVSREGYVTGPLYRNDTPYINYTQCHNSIVRHIINPNKDFYDFDIFCHCWNEDLEEILTTLYSPKMKLFEDNTIYKEEIDSQCETKDDIVRYTFDYNGISQALSIKKVIELKETYEKLNTFQYDIVILYRYDVFLWKDMDLQNYNLNSGIYVNAHDNCNGDFHFVMKNIESIYFKNLYKSSKHLEHYWIKNYITNIVGRELHIDTIVPGKDQEVMKKIKDPIMNGYLSILHMNTY